MRLAGRKTQQLSIAESGGLKQLGLFSGTGKNENQNLGCTLLINSQIQLTSIHSRQ
jgi:hypothetical protein